MALSYKERIARKRMVFDVSLYNEELNSKTLYKGATLSFLIASLKKLEGATRSNAKDGSSVKGKSKNSKNCTPTPHQDIKIK
jgi:hypothetical protein